jgi:hypothetical protein
MFSPVVEFTSPVATMKNLSWIQDCLLVRRRPKKIANLDRIFVETLTRQVLNCFQDGGNNQECTIKLF